MIQKRNKDCIQSKTTLFIVINIEYIVSTLFIVTDIVYIVLFDIMFEIFSYHQQGNNNVDII